MKRFTLKWFAAGIVAIAGLVGVGSGTAQAQPPIYIPPNPWNPNQEHFIHPSRLQPGANTAIPGTVQPFTQVLPDGRVIHGHRYLGIDGKWHGTTNITDQFNNTTSHHYAPNPNANNRPNPQPNSGFNRPPQQNSGFNRPPQANFNPTFRPNQGGSVPRPGFNGSNFRPNAGVPMPIR